MPSVSAPAAPDEMSENALRPIDDAEALGLLARPLKEPIALAVSGGADSMALMHLVHRALHANAAPFNADAVMVLTVDHQLRAGSAEEATFVAGEAKRLGFSHTTLVWEGLKLTTGLQAQAREARYRLMAGALKSEASQANRAPRALLTAHHADDQAETLLMRLKRGSGITGLAAMREISHRDGIVLVRPLLSVPKSRLVATLKALGATWREDPSNANERFERVRVRTALETFAAEGFQSEALAESARRLARADAALAWAVAELSQQVSVDHHGGAYAAFERTPFADAPEELRVRLVAALLEAHGGVSPPARLAEVEALVERLSKEPESAATLGGCHVRWTPGQVQVFRESGRDGLERIGLNPGDTVIWDNRFQLSSMPGGLSATVGQLGANAYATLRDKAGGQLPALAGATLPAIFEDERLVYVPFFDTRIEICEGQFTSEGSDLSARHVRFQCRSTRA